MTAPAPDPYADPAPTVSTSREETRRSVAVWFTVAGVLAIVGGVVTLWRPTAPSVAASLPPQAVFDGALLDAIGRYRRPRLLLAPVITLLPVLVPVLLAASPRARAVVAAFTRDRPEAAWRGGAAAALVAAVTWLLTLPALAAIGLVHEARWGFRTSTAGWWLRDHLVVAGGRWLTVGVGVAAVLAVRARWPRTWVPRLTVAGTAVAAVVVLVHPVLLQPLLLTTSPLPAGPVRDAVTDVLEQAGAADVPIVVADASRRTTRVNASITGLGPTEQVVLHDTLLELPPAQVAGVVAHELAHREHADVLRGTALTATALLAGLWLLDRLLRSRAVRRRTRARGPGDPRLVLVILGAAAVLELLGTPVGGTVSRRLEAAADHRALELGADPAEVVRTVRAFVVRDLAHPDPGWLVQLVYGTHPTPVDRIEAAVTVAEARGTPLPTRAELEREERALRHPMVGPATTEEAAP